MVVEMGDRMLERLADTYLKIYAASKTAGEEWIERMRPQLTDDQWFGLLDIVTSRRAKWPKPPKR